MPLVKRAMDRHAREGVCFLASGSSGNATLVHARGRGILIDCGISARACRRRMAEAGVADVHIEAILVTHEHTDHIRGVGVLARSLDVPVHMTPGTARSAPIERLGIPTIALLRPDDELRIGPFSVIAAATSHDAAESVAYRITTPSGWRVGSAADTGILTRTLIELLSGCHCIGIEANHDARMLRDGPYPPFLKQRIASDIGHLSNAVAASALARLATDDLQAVVALHLSEHNNTPTLARAALAAALAEAGCMAHLTVAERSTPRTVWAP